MKEPREITPNAIYTGIVASYIAEQGITLTRYAELLRISVRTVERWMGGEVGCPQAAQLIRLTRLHGTDFRRPEDLGFQRAGQRSPNHRAPAPAPGPREDLMMLLRREMLATTASALFATALTAPLVQLVGTQSAGAAKIGGADLDRLLETKRRLNITGNMSGSNVMGKQALLRERDAAVAVLRGRFTDDVTRARAHTIVASIVQQIGWDIHDLGAQDDAQRAWLTALTAARDAEPHMVTVTQAHVLENMGHQAVALGRPQDALDLLGMISGRERNLPTLMRANLCGVRAQATAAIGDVDETFRQLQWAEDHISDPADERDWLWNGVGWFNAAELRGTAGHALTTLAVRHNASPQAALDRINVALPAFRVEDSRSKARVQVSLFRLHAARGETEEAVRAGQAAIRSARMLRSPRVAGELMAVRPYLPALRRGTEPGDVVELDRSILDVNKTSSA